MACADVPWRESLGGKVLQVKGKDEGAVTMNCRTRNVAVFQVVAECWQQFLVIGNFRLGKCRADSGLERIGQTRLPAEFFDVSAASLLQHFRRPMRHNQTRAFG